MNLRMAHEALYLARSNLLKRLDALFATFIHQPYASFILIIFTIQLESSAVPTVSGDADSVSEHFGRNRWHYSYPYPCYRG